ncbi:MULTISPECIES: ATP-grasp domain-containing protein [Pontibacillus]|uniref:RimK family alpha-L-glutamate ligase n=1 Tax=Pontibacillus chungwhensis TaxID=265426 RepID=A0ABY8UVA7_9BACI|nr:MULTISPECIES: RimK family alpha-L-glutamate ligase [Pontibacillus]MCD5323743.1 RimK family alpha-L-glutamate ligase [Pontibacillus sp. HN14]WIF97108.1 RimK family alpha-L-glutamate ligase [Pontibacillus chungwhensis]
MHGWIVYNGHLRSPKFLGYAKLIQEAAQGKGVSMDIYQNQELLSTLSSHGMDITGVSLKERPDFVIFGDKDILLARQLEAMGIPVFNSAASIEACDHKGLMYQQLASARLPIPQTILGPKIFIKTDDLNLNHLIDEGEKLGFPLIIKEAYGSFGEQVYLVHTKDEMIEKVKEIHNRPFLLQEFISASYGRDVRLNVVGEKVVASMLRYSENDFRANITTGGKMEPYTPSQAEEELAIRASKAIGTAFCGVDLLYDEDEQPVICEVNGNAQIRNIYECTGINVADAMMDYVIERLSKKGNQAL